MKLSKRTQQSRRSVVERSEIIRRFHQSGLSQVEFAERAGVALSTFRYWLAQERAIAGSRPAAVSRSHSSRALAASPVPSPVILSEFKLDTVLSARSPEWAVELVGPTGVTIRSREALAVEELEQLLRGSEC